MKQRALITTLLAVALFAAAVPASAQMRQGQARLPRPSRSLFGGGTGDTSQSLVFTASLGSGFDDDLLKAQNPTPQAPAGAFTVGSVALSYSVNRKAVSGGLSFATNGRYYSGMTDPLVGTYGGGGNMAFQLGSRTTLSTSVHAGLFLQNMSIFPGYGLGSVPGAPIDPTAFANGTTFHSFSTGVQLSQQISKRVSLGGGYDYYVNDSWTGTINGSYGSQRANAGISYSLARGIGLRLSYSAAGGGFSGAPTKPFSERSIGGGVDFSRSLSLTRQSSLAFSTGLSGVSDQNLNTRYIVTGNASFSYEIGRSWTTSASFRRGVDFFQTFGQPTVSDYVSAGVGGAIGRRLQLNTSVGAVRGTVGAAAGSPGYTATSAGVGLQYALMRELSIGVGYTYYRYDFDNAVALPPGMFFRMERQSVHVSLNLWVPIMTRARRN